MSDREHDLQNAAADAPGTDDGETSEKSYKVGYGRPPMGRRFKPGCSGNPNGRPKTSRNAKTVVAQVVNEKVSVRENGRVRRLTKLEAMVQAAVLKAMKGDSRALNSMFAIMARTNQLAEAEAETEISAALPEDDAAIIRDFLRRQSDAAGSESSNEPQDR
jgi:hypothetical protein